jgi:hypothetical protein
MEIWFALVGFVGFVGVTVLNAWLATVAVKRSAEGQGKWLQRVRVLGVACLSLAIACGVLGIVLAGSRSGVMWSIGGVLEGYGLPLAVSGVVCLWALRRSSSAAEIPWRGLVMEASEISGWVAALATFSTWVLAALGLVLWTLGVLAAYFVTNRSDDMIGFIYIIPLFIGSPPLFLGVLGLIIVEVLFRRRRRRILSSQHSGQEAQQEATP